MTNIKKPWTGQQLSKSLEQNVQKIRTITGNSADVSFRDIQIGKEKVTKAVLIFVSGLVKSEVVDDLMEILLLQIREVEFGQKTKVTNNNFIEIIQNRVLPTGEVKQVTEYENFFWSLYSGQGLLLFEEYDTALSVDMRGWETRAVKEPETQTVVRGPREGFTETLSTNISLIRRRIIDPRLWVETLKIGRITLTPVSIMYMKGIANDKIVDEARKRLKQIDIDSILDSGYIEELIEDAPNSIFPTLMSTERPDTATAALLEGRIVIIVAGSPFVLVAPALFISFFQSAEDYYVRSFIANLLRALRYICLFIGALVPSLYIAITAFHQELIPPDLLISLAAQREGNPFPAFVEAFLMETIFEILREAGVRMPRVVGSAISIVGALVIGTAAVEAGFVSASMVIVVSITAIASFVVPYASMAISVRILRFGYMILAATFGFFGILTGVIATLLHLCSLRSFGVPYMAPYAPFVYKDMKDAILRLPMYAQQSRPHYFASENVTRQQPMKQAKPAPPEGKRKAGGAKRS